MKYHEHKQLTGKVNFADSSRGLASIVAGRHAMPAGAGSQLITSLSAHKKQRVNRKLDKSINPPLSSRSFQSLPKLHHQLWTECSNTQVCCRCVPFRLHSALTFLLVLPQLLDREDDSALGGISLSAVVMMLTLSVCLCFRHQLGLAGLIFQSHLSCARSRHCFNLLR